MAIETPLSSWSSLQHHHHYRHRGSSDLLMSSLLYAVGVVVCGAVLVGLVVFFKWFSEPMRQAAVRRQWTLEKKFFVSPDDSGLRLPFPSLIEDDATKTLSIIVPAYNEEDRMGVMLDETFEFLKKKQQIDSSFTYELIVVDDGSKDRTSKVALEYSKPFGADVMRVLTLKRNMGKGGAIQNGMLCGRGEYLLMADADGATQISDLDFLLSKLKACEKNGLGVAVGSRAHLEERAVANRKWYRNIAMYAFHVVVRIFSVRSIKDTQCGFKLFSRDAARWIFTNQRLHGWAFDAELLLIAEKKRIPIAEVAVTWNEIPGSKLNVLQASFTMARELFLVWFAHTFGIWTIDTPKSKRS
eukprot:TRINITY_DN21078_c0_g1_i2.p1 TRINITY_DN21078_c0_g1~~TRINITY_DN21078_c0_g1_i2.p1  ORF type:complete len:356 (+),score=95.54 TRINITY_DN21078_c0_g1_i2:721-1788(+)